MSFVFFVYLHVTFNNANTTRAGRKCFCEEFLSQAASKHTESLLTYSRFLSYLKNGFID
jgi:hypothetical protein